MIKPYLADQPVDDFGLNAPTLKFSGQILPVTSTPITIPGDAGRYKAVIRVMRNFFNVQCYVALNETAAAPASDQFTASTSELVGATGICREVRAGDTLDFWLFAGGFANASIHLYALETTN
jgi:hypothetical protein